MTLVEAAETPFEALLGREVGEALAARYRAHGLDLRTGTTELPPHDVAPLRDRRRPGARARALARLRRLRAHRAPRRLRLRRRHRHRPLDRRGGQAAAVARAILGEERPYSEPPYVWSDQFGLRLQLVGEPRAAVRVELEGGDDSFRARYLDGEGRLRAALLANRPREVAELRRELALAA